MAKNLADRTLQFSREIEQLEARCRKAIEKAERQRDQTLAAAPATRKILAAYHRGLAAAKSEELRALAAADKRFKDDVRAAEERRRRKLVESERKYREARKQAQRKEQDGGRAARAKWKAAVAKSKVKSKPLSEQRRLRAEADEALQVALQELREDHHRSVEYARLERQARLQDDLVDERLAVEEASQETERRITGAAIDNERAVAGEEAKMREALIAFPEARRVQEGHDRAVAKLRRECEREKDELFRAFRRSRRKRRH